MNCCVRFGRNGNGKNILRLIPSTLRDPSHSQRLCLSRAPSVGTRSVLTTSPPDSGAQRGYAVVDHSDAYESAMQGLHGQQLALARLEGVGKDNPVFDPFSDEMSAQYALDGLENEDEEFDDEGDVPDDDDDEDEDDEDEDDDTNSMYHSDGSVRRKKSVLATLRAGFPAGGYFAVIELGGFQHKVTTDDLLVVNRLQPVDHYKIGSVHTVKDVLLVGSSHMTLVGMPTVAGAEVDVMVEEITRDKKIIIFKKRRRKHSQRKNGFRRDITLLRVLDIRMPEEYKDHKHVGRDTVDDLEDTMDLSKMDVAEERERIKA